MSLHSVRDTESRDGKSSDKVIHRFSNSTNIVLCEREQLQKQLQLHLDTVGINANGSKYHDTSHSNQQIPDSTAPSSLNHPGEHSSSSDTMFMDSSPTIKAYFSNNSDVTEKISHHSDSLDPPLMHNSSKNHNASDGNSHDTDNSFSNNNSQIQGLQLSYQKHSSYNLNENFSFKDLTSPTSAQSRNLSFKEEKRFQDMYKNSSLTDEHKDESYEISQVLLTLLKDDYETNHEKQSCSRNGNKRIRLEKKKTSAAENSCQNVSMNQDHDIFPLHAYQEPQIMSESTQAFHYPAWYPEPDPIPEIQNKVPMTSNQSSLYSFKHRSSASGRPSIDLKHKETSNKKGQQKKNDGSATNRVHNHINADDLASNTFGRSQSFSYAFPAPYLPEFMEFSHPMSNYFLHHSSISSPSSATNQPMTGNHNNSTSQNSKTASKKLFPHYDPTINQGENFSVPTESSSAFSKVQPDPGNDSSPDSSKENLVNEPQSTFSMMINDENGNPKQYHLAYAAVTLSPRSAQKYFEGTLDYSPNEASHENE